MQKQLKYLSITIKLFSLLIAFLLIVTMVPVSHGFALPADNSQETVAKATESDEAISALLPHEGSSGLDEDEVAKGSISGFIWVDESNDPSTDLDGLYNGDEQTLADYPISLYAADNLTEPLDTKITDTGGTYAFEGLEEGSYIVGLTSEVVSDVEYALPLMSIHDNKFAVDWQSDPLTAYTEVIELDAEQAVEDVNAGMRLSEVSAQPALLPLPVSSLEIEQSSTGSISGFLWVDGNGMLSTDWNGLYDGSERPLAGFTVYLYSEDNLKAPLASTKTSAVGTYLFDELPSGNYVLGLFSAIIAGYEYLLPLIETKENKFAINWSSNPLGSYTKPVSLTDGESVQNMNAGMRLPAGIKPLADSSFSQVWTAGGSPGSEVTLDGRVWYALKRTTVNNTNVVLLMHKGEYVATTFGSSINYNGSTLQGKMTDLYTTNRFPTINSMAVLSNLGSSSVPTGVKANTTNQTTDVFFALSYDDYREFNNNKISPLRSQLKTYIQQYWSRSHNFAQNMWGIYPKADTFDGGLHFSGTAGMVPAVWVSVASTPINTPEVTLFTVDTENSPIGTPSFTTHTPAGGMFILMTPAQAPVVPGYKYIHWKNGINGTPQPYNLMIYLTGITSSIEVFLVYEKEQQANVTLSKTVSGDSADMTKTFMFWLFFRDANNVKLPQGTSFDFESGVIIGSGATPIPDDALILDSDGKATIELGHGQKITMEDIPVGVKINIVEIPEGNYEVSYVDSGNSNNVSIDENYTDFQALGSGDRSFDFLNTRESVPPGGIESESWAWTAGLIALSVFILFDWMLITYRRKMKWAREKQEQL